MVNFLNGILRQDKELKKGEEALIVSSLVDGICKVPWGPLPLYWMSGVLPRLQCTEVLGEPSVVQLLELVDHYMVYQEPVLRGAAQHNILTFILAKTQSFSKPVLENCLFIFWKNKVMFINTPVWNYVQNTVIRLYNGNLADLIEETVAELVALKPRILEPLELIIASAQKILLPFILAFSKDSTSFAEIVRYLHSKVFSSMGVHNRPYAADRVNLNPEQAARFNAVFLLSLTDILSQPSRRKAKHFLKYCDTLDTDEVNNIQISYLQSCLFDDNLLDMINNSLEILKAQKEVKNIYYGKLYIRLLSMYPALDPTKAQEMLAKNISELLHEKSTPVAKAICIRLILDLLQASPSLLKSISIDILYKLPMRADFEYGVTNREDQKLSGRFSWEFFEDQLNLLCLLIGKIERHLPDDLTHSLLEFAEESLELGGSECVIASLNLVKLLHLPAADFINCAYKVTFELRKNEIFWPAIEALLHLCLDNMLRFQTDCSNILEKIAREASTAPGIMGLIVSALSSIVNHSVLSDSQLVDTIVPLLSRGICFGPSFRRDQKIVTDTNRIVSMLGSQLCVNLVEGSDHELSVSVRVKSLNLLTVLLTQHPTATQPIIEAMIKSTMGLQEEVSKGRIRHFEHSEVHKLKNRFMQAMLVLSYIVGSNQAVGKVLIIKSYCYNK